MLWIVGKIFEDFKQYLDENHVAYGVFWDSRLPRPADYTMPVVELDLGAPENLKTQLQSIDAVDVSGILVAGYERYVLPAAYLAAHFKVPGLTIPAALAATDKSIMREHFQTYNPSLTPAFREVHNLQELEQFAETHPLPLMLKPASLMKSLLITRNISHEELLENYQELVAQINDLYTRYRIGLPPKVIVEEFLSGSMHTVAGFVDINGNPRLIPQIVDCVTAQEIGQNDTYLFSRQLPSKLPAEQQAAVLRVAEQGVRALGLTSCAVHVELIFTTEGPKIIEIGGRIGGYRGRMYDIACGIDLYAAAINTALNQPVKLTAGKDLTCVTLEIFPSEEGTFKDISALDEIQKLSSAIHLSPKVAPGKQTGRASHGYKAALVVMLAGEDAQQIERDVDYIQSSVKINLA